MEEVRITPCVVSHLIASQFPEWAHLPITPVDPGGYDNSTFRLGTDMCVRLPNGGQYALQIEKEQRWLPVLAAALPLPIPQPLALGRPGCGFPWPWSVRRWLDGETVGAPLVTDMPRFASDLGGFLAALHRIDAADGPPPGEHNFFRGGPLAAFETEARAAIVALGSDIESASVAGTFASALETRWRGPPVWVHGDVTPANLLALRGRLSAVIDFGSAGVGDPACDTVIAWTMFTKRSREAFRAALALDDETWARGRGWALWKALVTLVEARRAGRGDGAGLQFGWRIDALRVIDEIVADARRP